MTDKNILSNNTALTIMPLFWPNLPPVSLAYLKGYLEKNDIIVKTLDYNNYFFKLAGADLKKEWAKSSNISLETKIWDLIRREFAKDYELMLKELISYDAVGFSCYKSNFNFTLQVAGYLKKEKPGIKIVFGGPEITRQYFILKDDLCRKFKNEADFIIAGEGEKPLLRYLKNPFTVEEAAIFEGEEDPNNLSVPIYDDFNPNDYPKKNAVALLFSRGCIKKCAFCSERLLYKKYRSYPTWLLIDTIRNFKDKGIEYFIFQDSLINGDLRLLQDLCLEIINNFGSIKWEAQIAIRPDMPENLFEKIKKSGCYHLFVGLESGSDRTLRYMKKGYTSKEAIDFFTKLKSNKLSFGVSMIMGFPGESKEDYYESLEFVIKNKDLISKIEQVNPFLYYEGTELSKEADYRVSKNALDRTIDFIDAIKKSGFKYTKSFLMNLVEK